MKTKKSKSLKESTLLGIFCLALFFNCNGQLDSYIMNMTPEDNFYQIQEEMEIYLDSLIGVMDSSEFYAGDGEFKNFKKFVKMWEPRVTPHGEFMQYFEEEYNFYTYLRNNYGYVTEENWHELGPNTTQNSAFKGIGPMEFITFFDDGTTQSTQYMLVGSLHSGLFYSTNYGETCNKTGTDTEWAQSGCSWAVFNPTDHTKWYASTSGNPTDGRTLWIGKTGGIFKISNEGQTFKQIADKDDLAGEYTKIYKLIIDTANPTVLYASTNAGIFKTIDCEAQDPVWENKLSGLIWDMELKPGNSSVLYASQFNDEDSLWQIKRSLDYGETWLALQNQPDLLTSKDIKKQHFTIEVSKAKPDFIYCISRNGTNSFYYIDLATSNNWIPCGSNYYGFGNGHGFGVEQIGNVENIVVSNKTILTKYDISTGIPNDLYPVHVDVEDIIYHPYNIDEIWICTHGGVEKSTNGGTSWEPKYTGLGVAQVEKMATSYTDPKFVIGGLYHDGVQITESDYETSWNPPWNWLPDFWVDGMKPLIDNKDPNHMWGSGQKGRWRYSSDFFGDSQSININTWFVSVGVLNKQNPSTLFRNKLLIGTEREEVYRSSNRGLSNGINEYISSFGTLLPTVNKRLILGLYTPYNQSDYLIVYFRDTEIFDGTETERVFLTNNANDPADDVVWEELSIPRSNSSIAGIEFDPDNPDIIFLTYSRPSNETILPAIEMIYKIDYTDHSDPNSTDLTKNLPFTSARGDAIAVERGGDGGVYLATEFGVFFTNNEMQSNTGNEWKLVGNELPHVPNNGIEINYISNTLRVGTWGRGFWELPLPCLNNNQPLILSGKTQWDSYRRLDRSVVVNSGATLIITEDARIAMPSESKIIVAPGGRLIVDGGTITNACPGTWNGVEVWGDNTAHQDLDQNGNRQQGYLELKNGATIENAIHGVLVGGFLPDGSWDLDKAGGIVKVIGNYSLTESSAKFLNNKWAITYLPYENFHPFTFVKIPNFSSFNNTMFEVNNNYQGTPFWYEKHVRLFGVSGVSFRGCTFVNKTSHPRVGVGIECTQGLGPLYTPAGFRVSSICTDQQNPCHEESLDKCIFENLMDGIRVNMPGIGTFTVVDAIFVNNSKGIKMTNANNAMVLNSEFYIGQASNYEIQECGSRASGYGIYMDNCTGFAIEENRFYKAEGAPTGYYVGIRIAETQATDEIYKNYFEGLSYANYTEGKNWYDIYTHLGLAFFCNENTDNFADFYVVKNENDEGGIQSKQGDESNVTGNVFSSSDPTWHFYNDGNHLIEYYYCNSCPDETPDEEIIFNVQPEGKSFANNCSSHYGGEGEDPKEAVLTPEQMLETEQLYDSCLLEYNYYNTIFENLKDRGDTQGLLSVIENSLPGDMWNLREDLLDLSPHLSLEVLKSFADKTDVFPDTILFEILSANPDELRKNELINYLENKTNPLPASMIDQLRQTAYDTTYKTVLLQQMAHYNQVKTRAAHDLIRTNLNDSIPDLIELRDWLTNIAGVRADEQIIASYMYENDYTEALNLANQLPQKYNYNTENLAEHEQYVDMIDLYGQLWQEARSINELDSTELADIEYIAKNNRSTAGSMARGILETWYGYIFCDCLNTTDTSGYKNNKIIIEPNAVEKLNELNIIVKPNPANQYTVFDYQIPEAGVIGEIQITDINGRIIESFRVSGKQG